MELRELGAVIARAAVIENRKNELRGVEEDLANDKSADMVQQLEEAKAELVQLEVNILELQQHEHYRRRRINEIEGLTTPLRQKAARTELLRDAKTRLPKLEQEITNLVLLSLSAVGPRSML